MTILRPLAAAVGLAVVLAACSSDTDEPELADQAPAEQLTQTILEVEDGFAVTETFERDGPLTITPGRFIWTTSAGGWRVEGGMVAVEPRGGRRGDVAVTPLGITEGLIQVTMPEVVGGAGLVFRHEGAVDHWTVVAVPEYATWNLVKVVDDLATTVGNTGLTPIDPYTTVGVLLDGDRITVLVNGRPSLTVVDADLAGASGAGMIASGPDSARARWDDFLALGVGLDAPPTPEPMRLEIPTPTPVAD